MPTFKKLRPPGHGVDSNVVQRALPKKLKLKVSRRTVRRRLAEKGFVPQKKRSKSDLGPARMKKRLKFCKKYAGKLTISVLADLGTPLGKRCEMRNAKFRKRLAQNRD